MFYKNYANRANIGKKICEKSIKISYFRPMNIDKAKSSLDKVLRVVSILSIVAILFAVWFSIQFAKSKTKKEFDQRQIYFNETHSKFNVNWANHAYWKNKQIDEHIYECSSILNKGQVKYQLIVQLNKEQFNDQFNVKTKNTERPDLYEVVKYSTIKMATSEPNMPMYAVHQYFLNSNALVLHKYNYNGISENGNCSKSMFNTKSILTLNYDSYIDYEGIGTKVLPKDILVADQLPYSLRALLFSDTLKVKMDILENQANQAVGDLRVYHAVVSVLASDANTWTVQVMLDKQKENTYVFQKEYPNTLISMHTWDGNTMQLSK